MIIAGYQGIGKSALAGTNNKFIDLESSNFFVDGKRDEEWYKVYVNIAEHLSQQGYVVFTSSHKAVRDELKRSEERVAIAYPNRALKREWLQKLQDRYNSTKSNKDYKALINAKKMFDISIAELEMECRPHGQFEPIRINSMSYSLLDTIESYLEKESLILDKEGAKKAFNEIRRLSEFLALMSSVVQNPKHAHPKDLDYFIDSAQSFETDYYKVKEDVARLFNNGVKQIVKEGCIDCEYN